MDVPAPPASSKGMSKGSELAATICATTTTTSASSATSRLVIW